MSDTSWIDEMLEKLCSAQITAKQRGILLEGMEEEVEKLIAEERRLRGIIARLREVIEAAIEFTMAPDVPRDIILRALFKGRRYYTPGLPDFGEILDKE